MKKIAVIGSGSWGTALASVLASNMHEVCMWSHSISVATEISESHTNSKYLPGINLNPSIKCTYILEDAVESADVVLIVVPSHAMREIARKLSPLVQKETLVIHATKGIEIDTLKRMSTILEEELDGSFHDRIAVLSGPSHAEETILQKPTTIAVSIGNTANSIEIQKLFSNHYFRVYTNDDVIGVEIGGSLKNIIAIGAGLSDGLEFGDNAKAALLTRGLAEISRLGVKMGANPATFSGLTGIGDIIVTGTSKHSRNWKTGNMLAKGHSLEEALNELGMVAEGVKATKAAYVLAEREEIEMPIVNELYKVLFENKDPRRAVTDLMKREYKNESIF